MPEVIKRTSAYAILIAENQILLSRLARGLRKGKWSLVGGGIEAGETPLQALRRELMEEAGITLSVEPVYLRDFTNRYDYLSPEGQPLILELTGMIHHAILPTCVPCKTDSDGGSSDGCKWFPLGSLDLDICTPFVGQGLGLIVP
ncbi:MAG: NUDIX domain-containing protein [Bdellovibrionales bacterium]|nr:NUDIX domain-containing protein [Bdellovibrionales bacterium]